MENWNIVVWMRGAIERAKLLQMVDVAALGNESGELCCGRVMVDATDRMHGGDTFHTFSALSTLYKSDHW